MKLSKLNVDFSNLNFGSLG